MTLDELIEILQALKDGARIQKQNFITDDWHPISFEQLIGTGLKLRISPPEPQAAPIETAPKEKQKVKKCLWAFHYGEFVRASAVLFTDIEEARKHLDNVIGPIPGTEFWIEVDKP